MAATNDGTLQGIVERFAEEDCSWLTTVHPDGRPHAAPVWHVWWHGRAYIVTTEAAVKVKNIRHNSAVVITDPDPLRAIIIEGRAQLVSGLEETLRPFFKAKYAWDIVTDEDYTIVIEITPTKLLAWGEEGAGKRQRWTGAEVMAINVEEQRGAASTAAGE